MQCALLEDTGGCDGGFGLGCEGFWGQRLERDKVTGFKKLLSVSGEPHRYFCCLHHRVSTASLAASHLHVTSTHPPPLLLLHPFVSFGLN